MPRIRLIIEDDHGHPFSEQPERIYALVGPCDTLNHIEAAVEQFKNQALPQMEQTLLEHSQQQFVSTEKKRRSLA